MVDVGGTRRRGRLAAGASVLALAAGVAGAAAAAPVLPTGGQVTAGQASIAATGASSLTVNQTSSRAIIDWSSFSIGQGGSVQFDNGAGATLNRVTGTGVSAIDGSLSATGSVYLINQNGVIIGQNGVVNVGGTFVASTLDVSDSQFIANGPLTFSGASSALVVNAGKVGALGGDVALIAAQVQNTGTITAPNGDVGLIAGYQVAMSDSLLNEGKFTVLVGGANTSATNAGAITAAEAELRAEGGNVYALAGNTASVIKATGVSTNDGKVFLIADGGTTEAHGQITATGQVETSGETVDFTDLKVTAPNWLIDPENLTIDAGNASAISTNLATANVTLQTTSSGASGPGIQTSGAGDIDVTSAISWSSGHALTLDAYNSINITAPITVSGTGSVNLTTDYAGGSGGQLSFGLGSAGFAGSLSFTGTPGAGQALTINGQAYTLLYSYDGATDSLRAIDNNGMNPSGDTGDYALAVNVSGDSTQYAALIAEITPFTGVFEGLGHVINGANIGAIGYGGVFGTNAGVIRDLGVTNATVTSYGFSNGGALNNVGVLASVNEGTIENAYATGTLNAISRYVGGGLVGVNEPLNGGAAVISNVFTNVSVTGAGGDPVGGIAGVNEALSTGGAASITDAYAIGAVTVGQGGLAGGIVGFNYALTPGTVLVQNVFATGAVAAGASGYAGGVAGINETASSAATIEDAYAFGAVSVGNAGYAGGLVGQNEGGPFTSAGGTALITNSFAAGAVSATGTPAGIGGLVGQNASGVGLASVTYSYWDTAASGQATDGAQTTTAGSVNGLNPATGSIGLTTAQFESATASFSDSAFTSQSGIYPYLNAFFPNGVQIISGIAETSADTAAVGAVIQVYANGGVLAGGPPTSTSDGSYYALAQAGSITPTTKLAATITLNGASSVSGFTFTDEPGYTAGNVSNFTNVPSFNVGSGLVAEYATDTDYSATSTELAAAFGSTAVPTITSPYLEIVATNASGFTLDQPLTLSGLSVDSTQGITFSAPVDIAGGGAFAGQVNLLTNQGGSGGTLSFDLGASGFAGSLSFTGTPDTGQSLRINNQAYTLLYNLTDSTAPTGNGPDSGTDDIAGIDANSAAGGDDGYYALAVNVSGTGSTMSPQFSSPLAGSGGKVFSGTFEGLGHTVSGLTMSSTNEYLGLFGQVGAAHIENVGLVGGSVTGDYQVGSLAGYVDGGALYNVYSTVAVTGESEFGGLIGQGSGSIAGSFATGNVTGKDSSAALAGGLSSEFQGTITNSFATGAVSAGGGQAGGLVGDDDGGGSAIIGSYATGSVSGAGTVGGLVGGTYYSNSITNSYASGTVTGTESVGGLAGYSDALISYSHATGCVTGRDEVGGLVGQSSASISNSYASGLVTGSWDVGGLVGEVGIGGLVESSYATGAVNGWEEIGGLVGVTSQPITYSYATGAVSTVSALADGDPAGYAGGLAGYTTAAISNSYATGDVSASGGIRVGGLVGEISGNISFSYSTGSVSGGSTVGGLAGQVSSADVLQTYATGSVSGTTTVGGLIGQAQGSISDSYWDEGTTGQTAAIGSGSPSLTNVAGVGGSTGLSPYLASSYPGFTFGATGGCTTAWVIVDTDGSLNNAAGAAGGTRPMLLSEYSTTITNAHQLQLVALDLTGNYTLGNSFDASGTNGVSNPAGMWTTAGFVPLGGTITAFTGSLNGEGYAVGGLYIDTPSAVATGLFGEVGAGASVSNLALTNVSITGLYNTGALAGFNFGTLSNDSVSGAVSAGGGAVVGGLVGNNYGTITGATANVTVNTGSSGYQTGGLVGLNETSGLIGNSTASGNVTGGTWTGGLAGGNAGIIEGSQASGSIIGTYAVGGFVGDNSGVLSAVTAETGGVTATGYAGGLVGVNQTAGSITGGTTSAATVSASGGSFVGGLAGYNYGSIQNSTAGDTVSTGSSGFATGGLVGMNDSTGVIGNSTATGAVTGGTWVGGLVGGNYGNVTGGVYSVTASASGSAVVGGFAGYNDGTLNSAMAVGGAVTTTGTGYAGGLVGLNDTGGVISNGSTGLAVVTATGGSYVGGLVGYNSGQISGSTANDTINTGTSGFATGGLVGVNEASGSISNSSEGGPETVTGGNWTGGLVGGNYGNISSSSATGSVSGTELVGWLVGYNTGNITGGTAGSVAQTITGSEYVGGLVGFNDVDGTISASGVTTGTMTDSGASIVGGLVGYNAGSITNANAHNAINTGSTGFATGGLVGINASTGVIETGNAYGGVTGGAWTGGFAGANYGTINDDSWSYGSVSGTSVVGGFAGYNDGVIFDDDAANSAVSGSIYVGGLAGINDTAGSISVTHVSSTITALTASLVGGAAGYNNGNLSGVISSAAVNTGSSGFETGGLTGVNTASGVIDDSSSSGCVTGGAWTGGAAGANYGLIDDGSSSTSHVSGASVVGGLVGYNDATLNDVSSGNGQVVTGTSDVGGLVGLNDTGGTITSSSTGGGTVGASGESIVGGLVGENLGTITGSSSQDTVNTGSTGFATGGLVGINAAGGNITGSWAAATTYLSNVYGNVTGGSWTGGLVGGNAGNITGSSSVSVTVTSGNVAGGIAGDNTGSIQTSYSKDTINSGLGGGGIVGYNDTTGTIANTYFIGSVQTGTSIGGIVGINFGSIATSWSSGSIASGSNAGGLVGDNESGGVLNYVYWNEGSSGQANALGTGTLGSSIGVTGIGGSTGLSPDSQSTYVGFDFTNTWTINQAISPPALLNVSPQSTP